MRRSEQQLDLRPRRPRQERGQGRKLFWIVPALMIVAAGFYGLACGRLVVNATDSLKGNAYAMVTWPRILRRGLIVAMKLPDTLQGKYGDHELYLTKRIAGLPGDPVRRTGNTLCVGETCVKGQLKKGALIAPLWAGDRVPERMIAVFGDSEDSLDSRYAAIGPVPVRDVVAVGIEIPFPHWTELAERLR